MLLMTQLPGEVVSTFGSRATASDGRPIVSVPPDVASAGSSSSPAGADVPPDSVGDASDSPLVDVVGVPGALELPVAVGSVSSPSLSSSPPQAASNPDNDATASPAPVICRKCR